MSLVQSNEKALRTLSQRTAYESPWSLSVRLRVVLWEVVRCLLFRPTPKFFSGWRVLLLRLFGTRATGRPFVAASAKIKMPWNLVLEDRACIGPHAEAYNLGRIVLKARSTIAQEAYLCGGTHDFSRPNLPLVVGDIVIGADAFVCARAFILPGVTVGEGAIVGACAVVTRAVPPWTIVAGNPAVVVGPRHWHDAASANGIDELRN
ncbi:MAG: putative colanic acid biosynthesis acetyltransferase [Gemmataceae bacterium]